MDSTDPGTRAPHALETTLLLSSPYKLSQNLGPCESHTQGLLLLSLKCGYSPHLEVLPPGETHTGAWLFQG